MPSALLMTQAISNICTRCQLITTTSTRNAYYLLLVCSCVCCGCILDPRLNDSILKWAKFLIENFDLWLLLEHHHAACPCGSVAVSTISRHSLRSYALCRADHRLRFCGFRSFSIVRTAAFVEDDREVVSSPLAGRRCQR